jgi:hypothetical protein
VLFPINLSSPRLLSTTSYSWWSGNARFLDLSVKFLAPHVAHKGITALCARSRSQKTWAQPEPKPLPATYAPLHKALCRVLNVTQPELVEILSREDIYHRAYHSAYYTQAPNIPGLPSRDLILDPDTVTAELFNPAEPLDLLRTFCILVKCYYIYCSNDGTEFDLHWFDYLFDPDPTPKKPKRVQDRTSRVQKRTRTYSPEQKATKAAQKALARNAKRWLSSGYASE